MFQLNRKMISAYLVSALFLITLGVVVIFFILKIGPDETIFDGNRALQAVAYQLALGPRTPGSMAHASIITWIESQLRENHWQVELQTGTELGHSITNVIARRGNGKPWVIIGAHYDTRFFADQDPDLSRRTEPVPGANDGASGVAVLLELSRILPQDLNKEVWLVFLDAEDQGDIGGWDWILGSKSFVAQLKGKPDSVVIIDMVGDKDLNIYFERNSDQALSTQIWEAASKAGYSKQFVQKPRYSMLDDHIPFIREGIRAVNIIDFDYPFWHTTSDTTDKVSKDSLQAVGVTLTQWLSR